MKNDNVHTLINQQNGNLAFKIFQFDDNSNFDHLQRNNFYTLIWVKNGNGLLKVDFSEYEFQQDTLFTFAPYQPFMFSTDVKMSGVAIQFHSDFYCIHKNPEETNCDKVIFNNIYQAPFVSVSTETHKKLDLIISQIKDEFETDEIVDYELLVPNLKIFLITLSRIKSLSENSVPQFTETEIPFLLRKLKSTIEANFREKHSASDYASLVNISPNALAKMVKTHFNKTLTDLITERIIVEAKRELYLTKKPIKEIAWELGYADEFYFSRVFKLSTDISPQMYRDTVGFAKAEMN